MMNNIIKNSLSRLLSPIVLLLLGVSNNVYSAENAISGQLKLLLKHEPVGLYVQFDLVQGERAVKRNVVVSSGIKKITEHPVNFSLPYEAGNINPNKRYRLFTTVVNDPEGNDKVASMSLPVLTQGYPSSLSMVIQPLPKPIE